MELVEPVALPLLPGATVDGLAGMTTQSLAQHIQDQTSRVPPNVKQSKGGKQASPSLDQINIIMKFILARGLETSELILHLQNIAREIERLQEYGTGKTWYHIVHQLRKGQEVNKLFLQLKQATEELTMNEDVQYGLMLQPLQEKANPESQNYSNANLATIFGSYGGGWSPTKPRVNISGGCTMVDVEMKNERRGQIEIQSFLDTDFGAACNHLVEQLSRFSPSVEEIFPQKSTSLGSITLETDANAPVPMILWVYHNVFVWAELRMLELDEPMSLEDLASTRTSFKSLTDQLFENIRDGCVAARDEVIRPKVQHKSTPDIVHVGEVFAVQVSVDQQVFHDVQCDSSKLVFGDFDIQESDRKYTFLATETGEAFIRLNFAHPDTFNSTSVDLKVNIEPRQNK